MRLSRSQNLRGKGIGTNNGLPPPEPDRLFLLSESIESLVLRAISIMISYVAGDRCRIANNMNNAGQRRQGRQSLKSRFGETSLGID